MVLKFEKKSAYAYILFCILLIPSFQMLGFDMVFLGSGTPGYIRVLSLVSFVTSIGLYIYSRMFCARDIPIICYTAFLTITSAVAYFKGVEVAFSAMLAYTSSFYVILYFVRRYHEKVLDYLYYFFLTYWIVELVVQITPIRNQFVSETLTFIGHIQIYSMQWTLFIMVCLLRNLVTGKSCKPIWYSVLIVATTVLALLSGTSASIIAIGIMGICLVFYHDKKNRTDKFLFIGFTVAVALNIAIVFLNYQENFRDFLVLLDEDTSLNGRTYIWSVFIPIILKNPIIGNGFKVLEVDLIAWGSDYIGLDYCHNTILQEMANGGFVQTVLFMIMNISTIKAIKQINSSRVRIVAFSAMLTMYVIMVSESITYFCYMNVFIALVSNLDYIDFKKNEHRVVWKIRG